MTAEERIRAIVGDNELRYYGAVRLTDLRELLSLVADLRAANAEQRAVIERLSRTDPERCPHCGQTGRCLPNCAYKAISASQKARAGDVAAFIRDPYELGQVKP